MTAARELRDVLRAATETHALLRGRVVAVVVATVGVDLLCGVLAYLFERHANGTEFANFGGALFWTTTQLLTVSSSLANPVSTAGRVLDVAMEAYAITVVAYLAGAVGAFFHKRAEERSREAPST